MDLETIIKESLEALPRWCKGLEGDFESHDWTTAYGVYTNLEECASKFTLKGRTRMFPYYMCRHCHAVSNDFTSSPSIKRVR